MIQFWIGTVRALAGGFGFAYFWCALAAIYLLLRRDVDAKEFDDIAGQDDETNYGLPNLEVTPIGVPQVETPATADNQGDSASA